MIFSLPAFALQAPQLRQDLSQQLSSFLCQRDLPTIQPFQVWQYRVFDFDMISYQILADAGQWLSQSRVHQAAQTFARKNHHSGYAFALCSQQKAWIVTVPSPIPPVHRYEQSIHFSLVAARSSCRSLAIDHASQYSSKIRRIVQHSLEPNEEKNQNQTGSWLRINHNLLDSGYLTFTCLPKQTDLGPITWAMLPIAKNRDQDQTRQAMKYPSAGEPAALLRWINQQRQEAGLGSLQNSAAQLYQAAAALNQHNSTVHHHRPHLRKIRDHLKPNGFRLIGENRVRAGSPPLLAWLLWNSPRHRSLLLNPKATHIGINIRQVDQDQLVVLVLGEQTTQVEVPPIARRQSKPAKTL